jgi:signal transduction histidine kinase
MQYRWIDQLTRAQRQRTQENLGAALSNLESDFDVEITRAFMAFQTPFSGVDYAERYAEWLRHAPYPRLIRGVYFTQVGQTDATPRPVVSGEPAIRSIQWHRGLTERGDSFGGGVVASVAGPVGFRVFSTNEGAGAFVSHGPEITVDGNLAFVFPVMLSAPRVARQLVMRPLGKTGGPFEQTEVVSSPGPIGPAQWAIVVFDSDYITSTFLPQLMQRYFQNSSGSDYDVIVVDRSGGKMSRVVFPTKSAALQSEFEKSDGRVNLFELRLECFSLPATSVARVASLRPAPELPPLDNLSDVLARKPTTCGSPGSPQQSSGADSWQLLAKYRAGSLDQAVTTFRRRNLFLSGTVLLVLALGISMAILLTERARALAEMQAEFILGVSHELRTPLTVIRVAADNLRQGMVKDSDQARGYGEIIKTKAIELSNMVEETFTLARMQSPVIGHRIFVVPQQMIMEVLAENESALRRCGMQVELDIACRLPCVKVDVRLMKRCLGNLIQNAIKYGAAGRSMAVRARKVAKHDRQGVEISVEDHGPGISADDLPHIFEPFYRSKSVEGSQVPGIGLGLTLVKRAVEAHGGTVEVASSSITRFSIFLPANGIRPDVRDCG